jgi:hypothetical protein
VAPRPIIGDPGPLSQMLKTLSLSVMFFLTLGLLFAAYASVPL